MKLVQTSSRANIFIAGLIAALMVVGSFGCGKSEAQKAAEQQAVECHDARQKFKEAVAAMLVRTKDSTYNEFRQSRLDLETNFEANKSDLANIQNEFAKLSLLMASCDHLWDRDIKYPEMSMWRKNEDVAAMLAIRPSVKIKLDQNITYKEAEKDPEFYAHNYVHWGLAAIQQQCNLIISILDKTS